MRTLRDAANYIMKLPKAEQQKRHWQTAAEAVLLAAEDRGPMMHAHIGMLQALSHGKPAADEQDRQIAPERFRSAARWRRWIKKQNAKCGCWRSALPSSRRPSSRSSP
jgi:hypothetical protein